MPDIPLAPSGLLWFLGDPLFQTNGRMGRDAIRISGARQHNLKNVTVEIPRHKLVVMTGLSGSGKSSLA
ncbi:MAG: hypothetical protein SNJ52_03780, partial [Verrucomicrobiia bacterium]